MVSFLFPILKTKCNALLSAISSNSALREWSLSQDRTVLRQESEPWERESLLDKSFEN